MHQKKSKRILLYFFSLVIFGSVNNLSLNELKFYGIKKINITGLNLNEERNLLKDVKSLKLQNLFLINGSEIKRIMENNTFIENYKIFKRYPSTLDIKVKETIFLAKINLNGHLFLIGSNGKLTKGNFSYTNLPYIFGKPDIKKFLEFKKEIDDSKISYDEIKSFYYFQSNRWDIELKNNIVIKLSKDEIKETLNNALEILKNNSLGNIKVVDARVKNQVILND